MTLIQCADVHNNIPNNNYYELIKSTWFQIIMSEKFSKDSDECARWQ